VHRERLRIAARDLWGEISSIAVVGELTALADAVIQVLLDHSIQEAYSKFQDPASRQTLSTVSVIGLGKLGGQELGYGSDWDVLIAYDDANAAEVSHLPEQTTNGAINAVAETLLSSGHNLRIYDLPVELDARLRPEGRFGLLARTVRDYARYYRDETETWERQVLTKARPVAGNMETANAYIRAVHEVIYSASLPPEDQQAIQLMKKRMESERLQPGQRFSDLKLGHGGLSDIEFTAQLWQLRTGHLETRVRVTSTVDVLHSLGDAGLVSRSDAARLEEAYSYGIALRNRIGLLGGLPADILPDDPVRLRSLAVGLGMHDSGSVRAEDLLKRSVEERMQQTREIVERLFYHTIEL
jgi:[glutamine synthetase] adenylyltransferase / [glutamine synthetase]-adenylyl-L-tyrosine phosphorylase